MQLEAVLSECRPAFSQERVYRRASNLLLSALGCLGRHTVTGMLATAGHQFVDWSAAYRVFAEGRVDQERLWAVLRRIVGEELGDKRPFFAAMDDTLLGRTGRKVSGASWRRDAQGPPFQTNLVWGQRFVQVSALLPESAGASRARAIPVDLQHCPGARRPSARALPEEWAQYREQRHALSLSAQGAARLAALRASLDSQPENCARRLVVAVDGGYTNSTVLRRLPAQTTLIGRIRKDARLCAPPCAGATGGRPRVYGAPVATPGTLLSDDSEPWQEVRAWAAGRVHTFQVKTVAPVRWRGAGGQDLRLLVIRPLHYRLCRGSKLLYRQPGFLVCTDPAMPLDELLQTYIWRWEAEVAFREEKALLGMGQAQVRTARAVEALPAFIATAYSCLHLAARRAGLQQDVLARPRWQRSKPGGRCSTSQLISLLRSELWRRACQRGFGGFAYPTPQSREPQNTPFHPFHACVYAHQ